jgi:hypothetical protein
MPKALFDNELAEKEGWFISETNHIPSDWQLQRSDEDQVFKDDKEAYKFVVLKAMGGSEYHISALRFLCEHAPKEFELVCKTYPEIRSLVTV